MRYFAVILLVTWVGYNQGSSLLEMSQVLWSRVLNGGYHRVGKLDPLHVPVVKVDQSEGNTSYRVVLKNLEIRGLNASRIESVHIARGSLKSNLSDSEAGYVSYDEQKGLDSIRYRFHTLVKEPKPSGELEESASEQFDRVVEYDPSTQRAKNEEFPQRYSGNYQQQEVYQSTHRPVATSYSNMRVAVNPTPQNPSQVRVVYTNDYKFNPTQEAFVRPCVGACRRSQQPVKGVKNPSQQQQQHYPGVNFGSPVYENQRFAETTTAPAGVKIQYGGTSFSAGNPNGQSQFSIKGGHGQSPSYSGNFGNGQFSVKGQDGDKPGFNVNYNGNHGQFSAGSQQPGGAQFAVNKDDGFGVHYNGGNSGTQFSVKGNEKPGLNVNYNGNNGQFSAASQEPNNQAVPQFSVNTGDRFGVNYNGGNSGTQFAVKGGDSKGVSFSSNYNNGQFAVAGGQQPDQFSGKGGTYNTDRFGDAEDSASDNHETKVHFDGSNFSGGFKSGGDSGLKYSGNLGNAQVKGGGNKGFSFNYGPEGTQRPAYYQDRPAPINGDSYYGNEDQATGAQYQTAQFAEATTSAFVEEFQPFKSPLIRLEKQPGYVDVVYTTSRRKGAGPKFENLKVEASDLDDPPYFAFDETTTELPENHSYNFTNGEPLIKKYKADIDSKRIKDLERYAKEFQEKQGYYEEGMELIYHFGNLNSTGTNETLNRKKRQHSNEEDDVMHVIVRISVPVLTVKSGYALTGKVGKQPVRGNGLLAGNFTDVTADFTVELKQVSNERMIVRAARAKLVCRDHKITLQGMDEKGPAEAILNHGLMAAEAVAAMIADDLATKAVNEGNVDATIYKMYKNLPNKS